MVCVHTVKDARCKKKKKKKKKIRDAWINNFYSSDIIESNERVINHVQANFYLGWYQPGNM